MTSKSRVCGCRFIKPDGAGYWYQVVACPDHGLNPAPYREVPEP